MAEISLTAQPRTVLGKKVARLRRAGVTPANIYGHNVDSLAVQADSHEMDRLIRRAGRTGLITLMVEGEPEPRAVLVRDTQRKPTTDALLHVDFLQVSMRELLKVSVPLVMIGQAPVLESADCVVIQDLDRVEVESLPREIPQQIEVDVSVLHDTSQSIHVRDLTAPPGATILTDGDVVVVSVTLKRPEEEVEEAVAEEAPAGEAAPAEEGAQPEKPEE